MESVKHEGAKVYIYTRVSTDKQVDGYSLDAQKDEIVRYVQYKNMHIEHEYTDEGKSGKSIQGRPGFQQMMDDIVDKKDGIAFVICFKLSRFGRNTADILNSLKLMKRYGVHLICVKENIDSSLDSGKMMISILGAMAEIERDNINVQTMAGRREKARQGGWNGAKAPYGYKIEDGKLVISPTEAEHIRIIFQKYVTTNMGAIGVAKWMNDHGYKKSLNTYNSKDYFSVSFVDKLLKNYAYVGKIAYGKSKTVLREGTEDEYHRILTDDYDVFEGQHEAIIDDATWEAAQAKIKGRYGKRDPLEKEHAYIYSALLKCPICGKSLYGRPTRRRKRKDGTLYPVYYSYCCRTTMAYRGMECNYGQISSALVDSAMRSALMRISKSIAIEKTLNEQLESQVDSKDLEVELDSAIKEQRQALGVQRKLEIELDKLDVMDKRYERKYESLSRRLDEAFDAVEDADEKVKDCEARIESVKKQKMTKESVYESLRLFAKLYDKMNDHQKKSFVNSFIDSIDLYPNKGRKNGCVIKMIHFKFPVSYGGMEVYDVMPPLESSDETVALLSKLSEAKHHIEVKVDMDELDLTSAEAKATYEEALRHFQMI